MAKHKLLGLWITLGVVTTLVILPVALVYGCFYDGSTSDFAGQDDLSNATVFKNLAVDAFDPCSTEGRISYQMKQANLNQMLYNAQKNLSEDAKKYLKKFTVSINDDSYHFYLDVEVPLFKTRLDMTATLNDVPGSNGPSSDAFVFSIKDIKLGRIGGMDSLALKIAGNFLTDASIQDSFAQAGLHLKVSLAEKKITYYAKDLISDLESAMGSSSDQTMYNAILSDFLDNGLLNFDFYSGHSLSVNVPLSQVKTNAAYCPASSAPVHDFGPYRDKLKTLMNGGKIDTDETSLEYVFDFLIRGYQHCGQDARSYLGQATRDFSSVGINDITTYAGIPDYSAPAIPDLAQADLDASAKSVTPFANPIISINEDEITAYLRTTNIYGYSYILSRPYASGEGTGYKVNYIAVDDFYAEVVNDRLYLIIGVNMNGYETSIIFDTVKKDTASPYVITLNTDKVFYGTLEAGADLKKIFYDLINESFANSDWISFDNVATSSNYGAITVNFEKAITESPNFAALSAALTLQNKHLQVSLLGQDISSSGVINVNAVSQ